MYVWHVDYTYKNIWVCANERQTTRRQSQPQNHTNDSAGNDDRQTTDRQTNELYVCMYFQL